MTPAMEPSGRVTGKWCTPSANIASSASPTSAFSGSVFTGNVAISSRGVSGLRCDASTRERRSRSVTMPQPSRIATSRLETRSAVIRSAAPSTDIPGSAVTGARRTKPPTGRNGRPGGSNDSNPASRRSRILPSTNSCPADVPSTSSATSGPIR